MTELKREATPPKGRPETAVDTTRLVPEDKRKKVSVAWEMAKVYRDDVQASGTTRKPRIPIPTMRALATAGMSFDQGAALVGASRHHFRMASARAGVKLKGDTVPQRPERKSARSTPIAREQTTSLNEKAEPEMTKQQLENETNAHSHGLRGAALEQLVHAKVQEHCQAHKRLPSLSYLEKAHGISHYSAKRYWPSPDALRAMMATGECDRIESDPAPRATVSNQELSQVIAELVYGDTLVEGTYCDGNGQHHCDVINVDGAAYQPLIHKWRQHEADVSEILRLATELAA